MVFYGSIYNTIEMIASLIIILNLAIVEVFLSIDNCAVLAVLVKDLPKDDQKKALRWGIVGAYVLRGLCLLGAILLVRMWPLKIIGGLYLLYLAYGYFKPGISGVEETARTNDFTKQFTKTFGLQRLSKLWSTIILVEACDLIFSMDNIFASVSLSQNLWVVWLGVFIGIAAMRFIAGWFVGLLARYPALEAAAYYVIGLLGLKLIVATIASEWPLRTLSTFMCNQWFDIWFSIVMIACFLLAIICTPKKRISYVEEGPPSEWRDRPWWKDDL